MTEWLNVAVQLKLSCWDDGKLHLEHFTTERREAVCVCVSVSVVDCMCLVVTEAVQLN